MVSIYVPLIYITILMGSMYGVSRFVRKSKNQESKPVSEEWFGENYSRNIFFSLLQQNPPAEDTLLKAALVLRATEGLRRLMKLKVSRMALNNLLNRGGVGDELIRKFGRLEKETELELMDIAKTANSLQPGWNQFIFQTCNEIIENEKIHSIIDNIPKDIDSISQRWQTEKILYEAADEELRIQAQKELGVL
ncbi:Translocation protein sec66 [Schizosaccharomyces pombe]|uniref:Translocation protein sec66 n=1 Tax=Schizosaccharomyces pombe (strain 972 / ATCC 24843) TaxID=284812 RepID=SEC66_SCHPO|nr:putative translocation subcomplex subunit Sec66 [Schizosaccharomyces pombe]Q9UUA4.1 RecName: Full=Translocation protein sec66 [Schizosaccharomyces pombe 972h-]CAB52623.1 ER protein translocation subcomplex subunit Sec66 (predicted) [Schizosaccharomyces pombe]|eukprot:NP_595471.1 putative translocation subcomplex subunit Sec66 [Schizosaccharomyces pombe]